MSLPNEQKLERRVETKNGVIAYHLTRSAKRRRTMQVSISEGGRVDVKAPVTFSVKVVEEFIHRKSGWITGKVKLFQGRLRSTPSPEARSNELLYLGQVYIVGWRESNEDWGRINFSDLGWTLDIPRRVLPNERPSYAVDFLEKWFKSRAQSLLEERVALYAHMMGEKPSQVRVRSPKRLWGSCHPVKKVLHFNWKLVMAPVDVVDYVVVHELSHIKVADHSKRFWSVVRQYCPDFERHKSWLRQNTYRLQISLAEL